MAMLVSTSHGHVLLGLLVLHNMLSYSQRANELEPCCLHLQPSAIGKASQSVIQAM